MERLHQTKLGLSRAYRGPLGNSIIPVFMQSGPAGGFNNTVAILSAIVPSNMVAPGPATAEIGYIVNPDATDLTQDSVIFEGEWQYSMGEYWQSYLILNWNKPSHLCRNYNKNFDAADHK